MHVCAYDIATQKTRRYSWLHELTGCYFWPSVCSAVHVYVLPSTRSGLCGRVRFIVTTRISGTLFFRVCLFTVKVVFFPREITDYKCRLTPLRVGWIETGPSLAGRLHSLVLCWWVSSPESHTTRTRGPLRVTTSTLRDPSGSGRADTLTSPVAAARAAVATGAWVESKHDM